MRLFFFLQHCYITIWKVTLRILPLTFKPVLQHTRLLEAAWILSSDWIELHGSHAIHGLYVTIKRSTYTCFAAKSRTTPYAALTFRNPQQPELLQDRFDPWVVKRATSLFNSFCGMSCSFCCPFYCAFKMKLANTATTIIRNSRPSGSQQLLGNYIVASHLEKEIFQHTRAYYTVRLLIGETVVVLLQSLRLN